MMAQVCYVWIMLWRCCYCDGADQCVVLDQASPTLFCYTKNLVVTIHDTLFSYFSCWSVENISFGKLSVPNAQQKKFDGTINTFSTGWELLLVPNSQLILKVPPFSTRCFHRSYNFSCEIRAIVQYIGFRPRISCLMNIRLIITPIQRIWLEDICFPFKLTREGPFSGGS